MLKQVYKIDELGFVKEIKLAGFDEKGKCLEELTSNIITVDIPQGLYNPKWIGNEWISSMTEEEYIQTLPKQPINITTDDMIMLAIADLDMQRAIDKTETELAIAELAETLLGGI